LDGVLDVDLGRLARHFEHDDRAAFARDCGLLGNQRPANDARELHHSTSCSRSTAARVASMRWLPATSRAVRRPLATMRTPARLRAEALKFSSGRTSTTSVLPDTPSRFNSSAAGLVFFS